MTTYEVVLCLSSRLEQPSRISETHRYLWMFVGDILRHSCLRFIKSYDEAVTSALYKFIIFKTQ